MPNKNTPSKPLTQVSGHIHIKALRKVKRFSLFHNKRHQIDMGETEMKTFSMHLALVSKVSASAQNQPLSTLLFLYKEVLAVNLPWLNKESTKIKVNLTPYPNHHPEPYRKLHASRVRSRRLS